MNTAATAMTALLTFLATNLDDLLVLMLLWGVARAAGSGCISWTEMIGM